MSSKLKWQIFGVLFIVVIAALSVSAIGVAAQVPTWGGGGLIVNRFGDFFATVLRFLALIFGF